MLLFAFRSQNGSDTMVGEVFFRYRLDVFRIYIADVLWVVGDDADRLAVFLGLFDAADPEFVGIDDFFISGTFENIRSIEMDARIDVPRHRP